MGLLADLDANIKRACSCDWLYFNRELLTVFVSDIYSNEHNSDVASLQFLLNGACDCEQMLRCAPQLDAEGDDDESEAYVKEVRMDKIERPISILLHSNPKIQQFKPTAH